MSQLRANFQANLKRRRVAASMSQETLAEAMNCSLSYISMLERGQRELESLPSEARMVAMARAAIPFAVLRQPACTAATSVASRRKSRKENAGEPIS